MEYRITINGGEFRHALNQFKMPRKRKRAKKVRKLNGSEKALLSFDGKFFSIEAFEVTAVLHAKGHWPGVATIFAEYVAALAEVPPQDESLVLTCDERRVRIGTTSVPCEWRPISEILMEIPAAPDWIDLLRMPYRCTRAQILAAGMQPKIDGAERELQKVLKRAAKPLAPLKVTVEDLRSLVEGKLRKDG